MATEIIVCLDIEGKKLWIRGGESDATHGHVSQAIVESIDLVSVTRVPIDSLLTSMPVPVADYPESWAAFECTMSNGMRDLVCLCSDKPQENLKDHLTNIWGGLRQMCLDEVTHSSDHADDALLWAVSQKVNAAILILDEHLQLLKTNAAGEDILREGMVLRNASSGVRAARPQETRALQTAMKELGQGPAEQDLKAGERHGSEFILLLRGRGKKAVTPMSVSLFRDDGEGRKVFLAMLPLPPERKRIEGIARSMGLTATEARVAALMREGYSNRVAAEIAGLKISTFDTYAKRVLSKMEASCRSEMAQMLTWQSTVERAL